MASGQATREQAGDRIALKYIKNDRNEILNHELSDLTKQLQLLKYITRKGFIKLKLHNH